MSSVHECYKRQTTNDRWIWDSHG